MSGIAESGRHMRRAAIASVSVALLLVTLKTFAYFASHSVAMLASLADSALDLFTSAINMFAIREALTPADKEHRFGHGKAEPLAGLAQGAFITASALFLAIQAVQDLIDPQPVEHGRAALAVMLLSILLSSALVLYQRSVIRRTRSLAVAADQTHYVGDLATNAGVIIAILLASELGWLWADPAVALLVACVMVASAWLVFRQCLDQLMDRELPDAERDKIKAIVRAYPGVTGFHDLRTRSAGLYTFIQLHIELDPAMSLAEAHAVSDAVERELCAAFDKAEIIIHQDPAGLDEAGAVSAMAKTRSG